MGENQRYKATITLTNIFGQNVAWKIKTTKPNSFMVNPTSGILAASKKITVEIQVEKYDNPQGTIQDQIKELLEGGVKFMVMTCQTDL